MKEKNGKLSVCTVSMHERATTCSFCTKGAWVGFCVCGSEVRRLVFMCIATQVKRGY